MKNKYLLTALAVVGCSVAAQASTITWNFLENGANVTLGNSDTFTESGITLTAYGFNVAGNTPTALYAKDSGVGEQGLGIASDGDHEINPSTYVQIFTTTTPASSLTSLFLSSVQPGEIANVYVSSTSGSLGAFLGQVTSDSTFDISAYIGKYIGVTASGSQAANDPNVLLASVSGTVVDRVPDGGTTAVLLGGALMGIGLLRKKFLA